MRSSRLLLRFAPAFVLATIGDARGEEPKVSFNRDIEPILSEYCYHCHGRDPESRKAKLRLDIPEGAFAPREFDSFAIVPGSPEESELMYRITEEFPEDRMPPPEFHKTLDDDQIALIRRWIEEGAHYEAHWAFVAPQRPEVPDAGSARWSADELNPIDGFLLARLKREGLDLAPAAPDLVQLRRVSLDLTGLPPTAEELRAFRTDASPGSYARAVERLLASPHYGEHRARIWLDAARFADTHGLHLDNSRAIWPYRDYVIEAFNRNMPFDQFVREQLAGDLLPPTSVSQIVATGFIRAGVSSGEGGALVEELRVNNYRERTDAIGPAFLGLTLGCAACHDHKFDPITQRDYYALTAFFDNLDENPYNGNTPLWEPIFRVPTEERRSDVEAALARRAALLREREERRAEGRRLVDEWIARGEAPRPLDERAQLVHLPLDEAKGQTLANRGASGPRSVEIEGAEARWDEEALYSRPTLRLDPNSRIAIPLDASWTTTKPLTVSLWVRPYFETGNSKPVTGTIAALTTAAGEAGAGWRLVADAGRVAFVIEDGEGGTISVQTCESVLMRGRWLHLTARYDGTRGVAGLSLALDGMPCADVETAGGTLASEGIAAQLSLAWPEGKLRPLRASFYHDVRYFQRALDDNEVSMLPRAALVAEIAARPRDRWTPLETFTVTDFYFREADAPSREFDRRIAVLDEEIAGLTAEGAPTMVAREAPGLPYSHLLDRGVYDARRERVAPAVPEFLRLAGEGGPSDRRGLADWIANRKNPLTARVAVNRMWQEVFGTGIVETTEDFGLMGERPSHPELLDWLAVEFMESGWDMKHIYRLLVGSAAYRSRADVPAFVRERDPHNRLLARGPRMRLDAEVLRDSALHAAGLLNRRIGGPSVKPYQPPGIWETGAIPDSPSADTHIYRQDTGDLLHRRSVYTFLKRMAPMPNMEAFDAPRRDISCTRRQRTNTPLQALVTLNDPQWLEAARVLADRLLAECGDDDARFDELGLRTISREFDAAERDILRTALAKHRAEFAAHPDRAVRLLAAGEAPRSDHHEPAEAAAWMLLSSAALNLDATLNK